MLKPLYFSMFLVPGGALGALWSPRGAQERFLSILGSILDPLFVSFWERFGDDFRRRFMVPFFDGLGVILEAF